MERVFIVICRSLEEIMIKFYSNDCPKCRVLKTKLDDKSIQYEKIDNIDLMLKKNIETLPVLELEDGAIMDFSSAIKWINQQEG